MTQAALIREADVARIMRGVRKAGFNRVRIGIDPAGRIVVDASDAPAGEPEDANPLDRLLR